MSQIRWANCRKVFVGGKESLTPKLILLKKTMNRLVFKILIKLSFLDPTRYPCLQPHLVNVVLKICHKTAFDYLKITFDEGSLMLNSKSLSSNEVLR